MKLKNKKTGEIGYLIVGRSSDHYIVTNDEWESCGEYNSLAELTEEWEDVPEEEPKDNFYWYIDGFGRTHFSSKILDEIEGRPNNWMARKLFGNYFETKEEAEKAVEKLKAWKRLKDKGFKFDGLTFSYWGRPCIEYTPGTECIEGVDYLRVDSQVEADLDLLFRAEE